ncbi:MAG: histone deacetylase, partial [Paenibacillus sp. RIFOXYA1_FULL_44_5]
MDAIFVHHPEAIRYKFNEHHPFNQNRLRLTIDLLQAANALQPHHIVIPREASEEELLSVHTVAYVNAVKNLSDPAPSTDWILQAEKYGLSSGDTPFFPEMHTIASALVGGSIEAADAVMSGRSRHALHLGGGLHHALSGRGAGFCVYNDAAAAIRYIQQRYHARVLYIDTDVHHGDGVQWIFYTDPDVCTFSIHETGKHLFPGTGELTERGEGLGFGYCFNMPVEPYTEDQSWMENFQEIAEQVIAHFKPDIIVSQHGCDAHVLDPLSHLHCSMDIYHQMPKLI